MIAEFVDELPPGEWKLRAFGEYIVAVCPDHPPRLYRNGKYIGPLTPQEPVEYYFERRWS